MTAAGGPSPGATRRQRALLFANTARLLRPAQVAHRARLRAQRVVLSRYPAPFERRLRRPAPADVGWPEGFTALDARLAAGCPSPEANAEGRFRFLEETRELGGASDGGGADWDQAGADRLWRFHLHYFEWAWSFADHPDRSWPRDAFVRLWRSWCSGTAFGRLDAWSPYAASLRAWALCGIYRPLVRGGDCDVEFTQGLALHAGFLRVSLEQDVGGNHLVKNLKALAGLGVALADDGLVGTATRLLGHQLRTQVLADGGHYERSPSYHCQVLGDLIDVGGLLAAAGRPPVAGLEEATARMRAWLGAMLMPDGDVPLFNDCALVGRDRLALLQPKPRDNGPLVVLQPSGYVIVRPDDRLHLVADVGPPCPVDLPAHAHADCLSFELAVDRDRVVVDTGTSTYEAGGRRAHERSTRAHNTIEVDGADQTEVWGAFRAARRARATLERAVAAGGTVEVTAGHDGYRRLRGRPGHRRTWRVGPGSVRIVDEVTGAGRHRVALLAHLAPGLSPTTGPTGEVRAGPLRLSVSGPPGLAVDHHGVEVATGFGRRRPASVVSATVEGDLPIRLLTVIQIAPAGPPPPEVVAP